MSQYVYNKFRELQKRHFVDILKMYIIANIVK